LQIILCEWEICKRFSRETNHGSTATSAAAQWLGHFLSQILYCLLSGKNQVLLKYQRLAMLEGVDI